MELEEMMAALLYPTEFSSELRGGRPDFCGCTIPGMVCACRLKFWHELNFSDAHFGGDLIMEELLVKQYFHMTRMRVEGAVDLTDIVVGKSLNLKNSVIHEGLTLAGIAAGTGVDLSGARIEYYLDLRNFGDKSNLIVDKDTRVDGDILLGDDAERFARVISVLRA